MAGKSNPAKRQSYWTDRREILGKVRRHLERIDQHDTATSSLPSEHIEPIDIALQLSELDESTWTVVRSETSAPENAIHDLEIEVADPSDSDQEYSDYDEPGSDTSDSIGPIADDGDTLENDGNETNSDTKSDSEKLRRKLAAWATEHNVQTSTLNSLLGILRDAHHDFETLPKDARTLLKTQTNYSVKEVRGGCYYHCSLASILQKDFLRCCKGIVDCDTLGRVTLQINIDGLPLFRSSQKAFWPILGRIIDPFTSEPFVIGLFCGCGKPVDVQEYLDDFVRELSEIGANGVVVEGIQDPIQVNISCFICDRPARAFVKQIAGHGGYKGCDKCTQRGVYLGKVTFPETSAPLRTDAMFIEKEDAEHHLPDTESPLVQLSVGMISQFPLDYMHLVCLGVMKRLLWLWVQSPIRLNRRLHLNDVRRISGALELMMPCIPSEFQRKARSLKELDRWKATEFRTFLLYTGMVALKGVLQQDFYHHFLLLFVGVHCLVHPELCLTQRWRQYAHKLLMAFVTGVGELYGQDQLVYNIHGLVHLADDVSRFGPLDQFSAFPFESFLGKIKRLIQKPNLPLQSVIRRLSEKDQVLKPIPGKATKPPKKQHFRGPIPADCAGFDQYTEVTVNGLLLSCATTDLRNNCIHVGKVPCVIQNILSQDTVTLVAYRRFRRSEDFFSFPLPSSDLGIYLVSHFSTDLETISLLDITTKCMLLPYKDCHLEYHIVEFLQEKATAIVPSTWIEPVGEDGNVMCWWPQKYTLSKLNKACEEGEAPNSIIYALHPVRILNKRKVTDYQTARRMLNTSTFVSDIDDPSTDEAAAKIRKRAPPVRLVDEPDDSDEEPPLPKKSSHHKQSCCSTSQSRRFLNVPASPMHQMPKDFPASLPSSVRTADVTLITLMEKVLHEQRQLRKLMEAHFKECRKQGPTNTTNPQLPDGFEPPIQHLEEFENFDFTLADEVVKEGVIDYLALSGGETPKEVVRRALGRLMHGDLTLQYTFQGTPKKKAFKSLHLYGAMKKVVRRNHTTKTATEKEIDNAIKEFFRTASDRNGGRMRRDRMQRTTTTND